MLTIIVSLIIIGLLIADVFFVEYENFGWTTVSLIVTGVTIYWCDLWGATSFVISNGPFCIAFVGAYLVVGIIWSFIKWYSYLLNYRDKFLDIKNNLVNASNTLIKKQLEWVQDNQVTIEGEIIKKEELPLDRLKHHYQIDSFIRNNSNRELLNNYNGFKNEYSTFYKPEAISYKAKIIAWICYWPFSLVGTFINDPIRRLVNFLFTRLKATYQKMSDRIFTDFPDKNDL